MFNVLVVDDEKEIRDAIEIYLRGENLKVFKAEDGLEALDILEKEKIHLIILDIMTVSYTHLWWREGGV